MTYEYHPVESSASLLSIPQSADLEDVLRDISLPLIHIAIGYSLIRLSEWKIERLTLNPLMLVTWEEHFHESRQWISMLYAFGYLYGILIGNGIRGAALRNIDLFLLNWVPQGALPYLPGYPDFISSYAIVHKLFGISFMTQLFAVILFLFFIYTIHTFALAAYELAGIFLIQRFTKKASEITFNHLHDWFEDQIAQGRYQAFHMAYEPTRILLSVQKLDRLELPWLKTYGHPARPNQIECPFCWTDFSRDNKTYTCPNFGCHYSYHRVCVHRSVDNEFRGCGLCRRNVGLVQRGSI